MYQSTSALTDHPRKLVRVATRAFICALACALFFCLGQTSQAAGKGDCLGRKDFESFLHPKKWLTPARGEELTQEVRRVVNKRAPAGAKIGNGDNIAVAEFEINGRNEYLVGVSGQAERAGTVAVPQTRVFQTQVIRHDRAYDSEVKILEQVALKASPKDKGVVRIFSERPLCPSCSSVVQQFRKRYPGIEVQVIEGRVGTHSH